MRSLSALPAPATPLIGRRREVGVVADLVRREDVRLVTLSGPAGVGKTRLALEVASLLAPEFSDGAVFVPLAALRAAELVPSAVLLALGAPDTAPRGPQTALIETLRGSRLLLVLDNFEHLIDAVPAIAELLSACPSLTVLTTSRIALRLLAEHVFTLATLDPEDAVSLLVARLSAVNPEFERSAQNSNALDAICAQLEGLPLAIELAAARARALPLAAIADALESRLRLLRTGARDLPARQRTLRDAIAWSWDLLDERSAAVLARLAVFLGGWTLDAAAAVGAPVAGDQILTALEDLVSHSLVVLDSGDEPRYRMLEVVREYADEQLERSGVGSDARDRHALHFLELVEATAPGLVAAGTARLLDRLERERFNLHAAVRWAVERGDANTALRICRSLRLLWYIRGPLGEARALCESVLALGGGDDVLRATVLADLSTLARHQGDWGRAESLCAEAVDLARAARGREALAHCLLQLGFIAHIVGDFERARAALEESLALARAGDDCLAVARAQHHLGFVAYYRDGDLATATKLQSECLESFRAARNERQVATALIALAELARVARDRGRAQTLLEEAVAIVAALKDLPLVVFALYPAAALAADGRRFERALRLVGAAEGLERSSGAAPWPALVRTSEAWVTGAERALGHRHAASVRRSGGRIGVGGLIELLCAPEETGVAPDPLTRREQEIAALVAEGRTNRQIAKLLVVSERTVDGHVASILRKLGFRSRAQIAVWVAARDGT